jgi:hypothetical protein
VRDRRNSLENSLLLGPHAVSGHASRSRERGNARGRGDGIQGKTCPKGQWPKSLIPLNFSPCFDFSSNPLRSHRSMAMACGLRSQSPSILSQSSSELSCFSLCCWWHGQSCRSFIRLLSSFGRVLLSSAAGSRPRAGFGAGVGGADASSTATNNGGRRSVRPVSQNRPRVPSSC